MAKKPARVEVYRKRDEPNERLIKRLIKRVKKEKIIEQLRDRRYFEKPSDTRNKKNRRIKRENERNRNK